MRGVFLFLRGLISLFDLHKKASCSRTSTSADVQCMDADLGDDIVPPAFSPDGGPCCPRCGSGLTYVQTTIVRSEHTVHHVEVDRSLPGSVFVMPVADPEAEREEVQEFLSAWVECGGFDCGYRVSGEPLGEIDWDKP